MATDEPSDPASGDRERERERERDKDRDRDRDKDGLSESLRQRLEALVPDLVRRTFTAGMGAVFQTEDSLRKLTKDLSVPNVAGYLGEAADNTKDKVLEIIAREVREFLAHVNLSEEIARLLTTLSFEVKTEIRFIPNSERYTGVEPDVKAAVRVKRAERAERGERGERPAGPERDEEPEAPVDESTAVPPSAAVGHRAASVSRLRRLWRRAAEEVREVMGDDDDGPR
jgi:hypothetical protein